MTRLQYSTKRIAGATGIWILSSERRSIINKENCALKYDYHKFKIVRRGGDHPTVLVRDDRPWDLGPRDLIADRQQLRWWVRPNFTSTRLISTSAEKLRLVPVNVRYTAYVLRVRSTQNVTSLQLTSSMRILPYTCF